MYYGITLYMWVEYVYQYRLYALHSVNNIQCIMYDVLRYYVLYVLIEQVYYYTLYTMHIVDNTYPVLCIMHYLLCHYELGLLLG